ncbi:MAG: hypothetical protein LBD12_06100, partial [Clostridiales Family XIII bacterium]|nr:hypothetical protein [Clostridiales Family XIII bacterium]
MENEQRGLFGENHSAEGDESRFAEGQESLDWNGQEPPFVPGDTVGLAQGVAFVVEDRVPNGDAGYLYKVHHPVWGISLALEQPFENHPHLQPYQKQAFLHACGDWMGLGLHPNIVSCYFAKEIDGRLSVFSEWMGAGSVGDLMRTGALYDGNRRESVLRILDYSIQAARGLRFARERFTSMRGESKEEDSMRGRRMNPDKLLLSEDGTLKIAGYRDCGLADWAFCVLEMLCGNKYRGIASEVPNLAAQYPRDAEIPAWEARGLLSVLRYCLGAASMARADAFGPALGSLLTLHERLTGRSYGRPGYPSPCCTAGSMNNRALAWLEIGRTEDALDAWDKAAEADPNHAPVLYNRAAWYCKEGDGRAQEAVRQLASCGAPDAPGYYAGLLLRIGDTEAATRISNAFLGRLQYDDEAMKFAWETASAAKQVAASVTKLFREWIPDPYETCFCEGSGETLVFGWGGFLYDVSTDTIDMGHSAPRYINTGSVRLTAAVFSPDGTELLTGGEDGILSVRRADTGAAIRRYKGHEAEVVAVSFADGGDRMRSFDTEGVFIERSLSEPGKRVKQIPVFSESAKQPVIAGRRLNACFSKDGGSMLVWDEAGSQGFWLWVPGMKQGIFFRTGLPVAEACFSPDGQSAAAVSGDEASVWHLASGKKATAIETPDSTLRCVCYSGDGSKLLTGARSVARVWDVETETLIDSLPVGSDFEKNGACEVIRIASNPVSG